MTRRTDDKNRKKSSSKRTSTRSSTRSTRSSTRTSGGRRTRGSHSKKPKVNKLRVALAVAGVIAVVLAGGFLIKTVFNAGAKVWPNVVYMKKVLFDNDTSNANSEEQFDLGDEQKETLEKKTIVFIDVARGGNDKGFVTESGVSEKEVNLKIAENVAKRLSRYNDVTVVLSRTDDVSLSADERKIAALSEKADLFVSIGTVSANQEDAKGVETIYSTSASGASADFASIMQTSIAAHVNTKNRGTNAYDLYVLRDNEMPSIAVQCGFLSNEKEAKNLLDETYQGQLSEGIAQGVLGYIDAQK